CSALRACKAVLQSSFLAAAFWRRAGLSRWSAAGHGGAWASNTLTAPPGAIRWSPRNCFALTRQVRLSSHHPLGDRSLGLDLRFGNEFFLGIQIVNAPVAKGVVGLLPNGFACLACGFERFGSDVADNFTYFEC